MPDHSDHHHDGPRCCRQGCTERATVLVTGPARVQGVVVLLLMCSGCSLAASTALPDVEVRQLPQRRRLRSA